MSAATKVPPELAFLQWLIDQGGMRIPRIIPGNRWAAIQPKMFTHAIAIGPLFDYCGIDTHWCYATYADARAALDVWDGTGEPYGWIRHPDSGRRVAQTDDETDGEGKRVEKGAVYVRI